MSIYRVEFRLSLSNNSSDGRNLGSVRTLDGEQLAKLFDVDLSRFDVSKCRRVWFHYWPDGWWAEVAVRVVPANETPAVFDGLLGYDWMIDNILAHGEMSRGVLA